MSQTDFKSLSGKLDVAKSMFNHLIDIDKIPDNIVLNTWQAGFILEIIKEMEYVIAFCDTLTDTKSKWDSYGGESGIAEAFEKSESQKRFINEIFRNDCQYCTKDACKTPNGCKSFNAWRFDERRLNARSHR